MNTRLIVKYRKPEQKAGAKALEKFCNEWAEEYYKAQEQDRGQPQT